MTIELHNIGMIKEATVKIDGLTVIAGENDTGKSTVGKALFALIKSDNISRNQSDLIRKQILATRLNLIFDANVSNNGSITLSENNGNKIIEAKIIQKNFVESFSRNNDHKERFFDATLIQSPIVFDLTDFFNSIARMKERQKFEYGLDFDVNYPYLLWDVFDKISKQNPFPRATIQNTLAEKIQSIIGGEFKQESGKFFFYKYLIGKALKIEMLNTATGIKSFGLLQLLNENGFINSKYHLILDEPEVHLHPEWQLKYAAIIVELAKNGINILVNSHSPYMIEALKRYADREEIEDKTNFYLAEEGYIKKVDDSNSETLVAIYEKLSEPYDVFEQMESERFTNG